MLFFFITLFLSYNLSADPGVVENPIVQLLQRESAFNVLEPPELNKTVHVLEDNDNVRKNVYLSILIPSILSVGIIGAIIGNYVAPCDPFMDGLLGCGEDGMFGAKLGAGTFTALAAYLLSEPAIARRANAAYDRAYSIYG